ncbi:MAG TPA: cell division protein ZapA [Candidatus Aminicenantes bacterium]|nr:cell division protein ZapA [Candidatus Aminicenantes bacterium]
MPREVEIQVLGKSLVFSIADDISPDDFIQVVDYVENKINQIKGRMNELDSFRLGLLAAINVAQDYFTLKKENHTLKEVLGRIDVMLTKEDGKEPIPIRFSS